MDTSEKRFEHDIESYMINKGGYEQFSKQDKNGKWNYKYEYDPEKARELLKEAGYENGEGLPTIELMYNSEGAHKDVCQIVQQNLAEIGINIELTK